jgi:hypothetical protein
MPPGAAIAMLDGHDASSLSEVPGGDGPGAGDDRGGGGTSSASVGGGSTGAPASSSKSGGKKAKVDRAKSRGGYRCGKVSRVVFLQYELYVESNLFATQLLTFCRMFCCNSNIVSSAEFPRRDTYVRTSRS